MTAHRCERRRVLVHDRAVQLAIRLHERGHGRLVDRAAGLERAQGGRDGPPGLDDLRERLALALDEAADLRGLARVELLKERRAQVPGDTGCLRNRRPREAHAVGRMEPRWRPSREPHRGDSGRVAWHLGLRIRPERNQWRNPEGRNQWRDPPWLAHSVTEALLIAWITLAPPAGRKVHYSHWVKYPRIPTDTRPSVSEGLPRSPNLRASQRLWRAGSSR